MLDEKELQKHFRKTICPKIKVIQTNLCPGLGGYLCIGCQKFLGPLSDISCPNLGRDIEGNDKHCRHEKVVRFKEVYDALA